MYRELLADELLKLHTEAFEQVAALEIANNLLRATNPKLVIPTPDCSVLIATTEELMRRLNTYDRKIRLLGALPNA